MENPIYLNAARNGYGIDQCGSTMTVRDLIAYLEQFDCDAPIYLKHDGGYTYGNIQEMHFECDDECEEDTEY